MSSPLRVALVAEGPTDKIVIEAAIQSIVANAPFIIHQLQPEESLAFVLPEDTTGWGGVYRWCHKASKRSNGAIESDILFSTYQVLVIHLDADVASEEYANAHIVDGANDLPCLEACPPASRNYRATTLRYDALDRSRRTSAKHCSLHSVKEHRSMGSVCTISGGHYRGVW
jgi:hypothetical protein